MLDKAKFFEILRGGKLLGPVLDAGEAAGVGAILDQALTRKWPVSWTAYALATAYHETSHSMQPIKEMGGVKYLTRMYDPTGDRPALAKSHGNTTAGDGVKYCGRGFVQLTWKDNYAKAERILKIDGLVANPDLAMKLENAAKILGSGMESGWFSGKALDDYLPHGEANAAQFQSARRIINGIDKKELIADYAMRFQNALKSASY